VHLKVQKIKVHTIKIKINEMLSFGSNIYVINIVSFCGKTLQSGECFFWQEISPLWVSNCQDFTLHPVSLYTYTKQKYMYMIILS